MSKKKVFKNVQDDQPESYRVTHPDGHIYVTKNVDAIAAANGCTVDDLKERGWTVEPA